MKPVFDLIPEFILGDQIMCPKRWYATFQIDLKYPLTRLTMNGATFFSNSLYFFRHLIQKKELLIYINIEKSK